MAAARQHAAEPVLALRSDEDGNWKLDVRRPSMLTKNRKKDSSRRSRTPSFRAWRSAHRAPSEASSDASGGGGKRAGGAGGRLFRAGEEPLTIKRPAQRRSKTPVHTPRAGRRRGGRGRGGGGGSGRDRGGGGAKSASGSKSEDEFLSGSEFGDEYEDDGHEAAVAEAAVIIRRLLSEREEVDARALLLESRLEEEQARSRDLARKLAELEAGRPAAPRWSPEKAREEARQRDAVKTAAMLRLRVDKLEEELRHEEEQHAQAIARVKKRFAEASARKDAKIRLLEERARELTGRKVG